MADEEEPEEYSGPAAGRKKGSGKSGWCLSKRNTEEHERCPVTVGSFSCSCTCANHGSRKGEVPQWQTAPYEEENEHEPEPTTSG